jgi:hypothetical protein
VAIHPAPLTSQPPCDIIRYFRIARIKNKLNIFTEAKVFKRKLETRECIILFLCAIILLQLISSIFLHSHETVIISSDGQVATVPTGDTLIAQISKSIVSITPSEDNIEVRWFLLGWHKWGKYPIDGLPLKILGFKIEKTASQGEETFKVVKPNNIFTLFR